MLNALLFLTIRGSWNRFLSQVKRLRQPRYALALLAGGAYFWFFLIAPGRADPSADPFTFLTTPGGRSVITLGVFILFASSWLFGRRIDALAFSQAEVHFLFPAPVTRRWLITFKLVRMQIAILLSALIWTLLVRGGVGDVHPLARATGFWLLFATVSIHQVGAALVHVSILHNGLLGARGPRLIATLPVLVSTLFAWAGYSAWTRVSADPSLVDAGFLPKLGAMSDQPLLNAIMTPFELLGTTAFASGPEEWVRSLPVAALIFLVHLLFVLQANFAFEESAADASTRVAKRIADFRQRGIRGSPNASARTLRTTRLPLAARGSPAIAIVWKNALAFLRSLRGTSVTLVLVMAAPLIVVFVLVTDAEVAREATFGIVAMLLVWSLILGPRFVRNDLRSDLAQLSLLKTFPLSGTKVVAAEVMSATLSLAAIQMVVVLVGFGLLAFQRGFTLSVEDRLVATVILPFGLVAINAVNMTIQNGATLLFPAWTTLGLNRPGGFEAMGQTMLMALASVILLLIALLPAAIAGFVMFFVLEDLPALLRTLVVAVVALAIVTVEVIGLMHLLGRLFERTEPSAVS